MKSKNKIILSLLATFLVSIMAWCTPANGGTGTWVSITSPYSIYRIDYQTTATSLHIKRAWFHDSWGLSAINYTYNGVSHNAAFPEPSDTYTTTLLATGLTPNTAYSNSFYLNKVTKYYGGTVHTYNAYKTFITDTAPATNPTYSNIQGNQVTVSWTKGTNAGSPNYIVYRGPSSTGPWTSIYIGAETSTTNAGLSANSIYYYYVATTGLTGVSANSGVTSVTTGADPAVTAANAAKGAAESSMAASELAKTTSLETKAIVEDMNTKVNDIDARLSTVDTEINNLSQNIANLSIDSAPPVIADLYFLARKSITNSASETLAYIVSDNVTPVGTILIQVIKNGTAAMWNNNTGSQTMALTPGLNTIVLQAKDEGNNIAVSNKVCIWRI